MSKVGFFESLIYIGISYVVWTEVLHNPWWVLLILFLVAFILDAIVYSFTKD